MEIRDAVPNQINGLECHNLILVFPLPIS